MQSGLSAAVAATERAQQQSAEQERDRKAAESLATATSRSNAIERVIRDLEPALRDNVSIRFGDQHDRRSGRLDVDGKEFSVIVDTDSYSLYVRDDERGRDREPYEGSTSDLSTFLGSVSYLLGLEFPHRAAEIDAVVKSHIPVGLDDATI